MAGATPGCGSPQKINRGDGLIETMRVHSDRGARIHCGVPATVRREHPPFTHFYGALTPMMRAPLRGSADGNEAVLRSFLEKTLHEHTL